MRVITPAFLSLYCRECARVHGFRLSGTHYVTLYSHNVVPMPESLPHVELPCEQRISVWTVMTMYSVDDVRYGRPVEVLVPMERLR